MLFQKLSGKGPASMISPSAPLTLWAWGRNVYGRLGLGDTVYRSSPVQVGALTTWASISIRGASLAVNNDGTLWSWGKNTFGQLGLGNTVYRSSPVQVGTLTTWSTTATGNGHVLAIKTNGTLGAW